MDTSLHPVILFDGICNLCNSAVNFVIRKDSKKKFRFAPLQSKAARHLMSEFNLNEIEPDSFILIYNNNVYKRSAAALMVLKLLGGGFSFLYGFIIVPPFIRNAVYNLVSRYRYKWFGKKSSCMIPRPEIMEVFLK